MGLGAPRKRLKISNDPNNTQWSRSTTNYGQKVLLSQGWTPGSFLGAKHAPHAIFHSAANVSHVRVALKDDNLGLGAQRGTGQSEGICTGLDAFQGLLGRLNGKSKTELVKEQNSYEDTKRAVYTERRWGLTRFVSGGLLVGDRIKGLEDQSKERNHLGAIDNDEDVTRIKERKRMKNAEHVVDTDQLGLGSPSQSVGPQSQLMSLEGTTIPTGSPDGEAHMTISRETQQRAKKAQRKFEKIQARQAGQKVKENIEIATPHHLLVSRPKDEDKARKKANKAQRKVRRRRLKENQHLSMADGHVKISPLVSHDFVNDAEVAVLEGLPNSPTSPVSIPTAFTGGRHAVRLRHIQQKRMAVMDTTALREILMIKA